MFSKYSSFPQRRGRQRHLYSCIHYFPPLQVQPTLHINAQNTQKLSYLTTKQCLLHSYVSRKLIQRGKRGGKQQCLECGKQQGFYKENPIFTVAIIDFDACSVFPYSPPFFIIFRAGSVVSADHESVNNPGRVQKSQCIQRHRPQFYQKHRERSMGYSVKGLYTNNGR